MRPLFVVFDFQPVGGFPNLVQIAKQVQVEHFRSIGFVKPFNIRIQVQLAVDAINTLVVPAMSLMQILPAFPEAPAGMFVEQSIDGIDDFCIAVLRYGTSVIGRPRQTDTAATALYGYAVLGDQIGDGFTLVGRP